MILLNGISGFNGPCHLPVDGKKFKRLCFDTVLNLGGNIVSFHEPQVAQDYFYIEVKISGETLYILLNRQYPFISFSSSIELGDMTFVDNKKLYNQFSLHYRILNSNELNEQIVWKERRGKIIVENANELNDAELCNIKYWNPRTVGDIVFNYWD